MNHDLFWKGREHSWHADENASVYSVLFEGKNGSWPITYREFFAPVEELTGKRTSETDHGVSGQRTKEECMQSDFF